MAEAAVVEEELEEVGETQYYLTQSQVELFEMWIKGLLKVVIPKDSELEQFVLGTTVACPVCNVRDSRYHGHECT